MKVGALTIRTCTVRLITGRSAGVSPNSVIKNESVWGMSRCPCFKFELKHILEQISPNLNHYIALFCVEKG